MDYITDLGHFLDDRGEIPGAIPKKARELASFLALIVDACTLAESRWDRSRATGISCREPGCRGALEAAIRLSDDRIRWACTDCDSNGLISGWRGTRWDNFRHHDADGDLESGWHDADDDLPDGFPEDDGPIDFPGPIDGSGPAVDLFNAFLAAHPGGTFESMTELNAQYADFVDDRNRLPEPDFAGLSRHEIHGLMYYPFDSPDTIRFSNEIPGDADAPILTVLRAAVDEIAGAGLKPTATGAFQTAFVRRIAPLIWSESCELLEYAPSRVRREANVRDVHRIRRVSGYPAHVRPAVQLGV